MASQTLPLQEQLEDSKPDKQAKTTAQYNVYNRSGELLTTYVVNKEGNVMKVVKKTRTDGDEDEDGNNSIKLGLVSNFVLVGCLVGCARTSLWFLF